MQTAETSADLPGTFAGTRVRGVEQFTKRSIRKLQVRPRKTQRALACAAAQAVRPLQLFNCERSPWNPDPGSSRDGGDLYIISSTPRLLSGSDLSSDKPWMSSWLERAVSLLGKEGFRRLGQRQFLKCHKPLLRVLRTYGTAHI